MLESVTIQGKQLSLEEILENMADKIKDNHPYKYMEHRLFYREASTSQIQKMDLALKSVKGISKNRLRDSSEKIKEFEEKVNHDKTIYFTNFLSKLYKGKGSKMKINVEKASTLRDMSKNQSNENIQQQMSNIMLQYLDSTHYFNVKSGLLNLVDSVKYSKTRGATLAFESFNYENLNYELENAYKDLTINYNSKLDFIYYPEDYNFIMDGVTNYDGQLVYILSFTPKKKNSIYTGKIYVSTYNFGVLKTVF